MVNFWSGFQRHIIGNVIYLPTACSGTGRLPLISTVIAAFKVLYGKKIYIRYLELNKRRT